MALAVREPSSVDPGSIPSAPSRLSPSWLLVALVALPVGLVLQDHTWWRGMSWLLGLYLIWSVAVPCGIAGLAPRRWAVPLALAVTLVPLTMATVNKVSEQVPQRLDVHDGGVLATDAAASQFLAGTNPYDTDNTADLAPLWDDLDLADGSAMPNPLRGHYPYLPAAFLVTAPGHAAADALGIGWDPRVLYLGVVIATLLVVARLDRSPYLRAGMLCAIGSGLLSEFLAWGTNDAVASCSFLLALLLGERRPRLAGVLLAVAVSFKFLLLVPAIPLAMLVWRRGGLAELRRWWTAPAVLAATCLPFLLADPGAFVEDTVLFNLGLTEPRFPTSGIGLPAVLPGVFQGPVLALTTVALALAGLAVPAWLVHRRPTVAVAGLAGAFGLLCLLVPARTFQHPYLILVAVLAATAWLALPAPDRDAPAPI